MSETVNSSLKATVKGTTLVLLGLVISMPLWFATKILIVRSTTKEEFGIYSLALAAVTMISTLATLGLQEGATRFVSIFLGEGKKDDAEAASISAIRIGLASGVVFSMLMFLFAGPVARHFFYMPELASPLKVVSLPIIFFVLAQVICAVLRAHNIIRPKVYYINIGQPLYFLVFLGICLILSLPFISILYAYFFATVMVFVSISSYGYRKIRLNPFSLKAYGKSAELLKFSIPIVIGSIAHMVLVWTDTFMIGRYMVAEDVGVYSIAISLARLLTFFLGGLVFVFMPLAGEMHAKGQHAELKRTYQVLTKWVFSITLPLFFVLLFFPEMIITFLFGEQYVVSSEALRMLLVGFMFPIFLGANGMLLMVFGFSKTIMNVSVAGAALNVVLNYVFIKHLGLGINGAALASMISYVAINTSAAVILYQQSRIHPFTARYLKPVAGSTVAALLIYALAKSLPLYLWMLPLYLAMFVLCYLAFLLLTRSLDKEDISLFEAVSARAGLRMEPVRKILQRFVH